MDEPLRRHSFLRQPKSVWAVAFACGVSFMGSGLVSPILPTMASRLHATPAQMSLLFTSYLSVTAVTMLATGWVSFRIGAKRTLVVGLLLTAVFSGLAGASHGLDGIIGFRAGWGLGHALFIATALAVIVGASSGGIVGAIVLYEAALGIGIALGPVIGGFLSEISWRLPFFGVSTLMAIGLICVITLVAPTVHPAERVSVSDPIKALRHRGLLTTSIAALLYNCGLFIVISYAPYPMKITAHELGFVFFGWGVLIAIFSAFCAPWAQRRIGTARSLYLTMLLISVDVAAIGYWIERPRIIMICVIASGALIGMNNTLLTGTAMHVAQVPGPTASAAYNFVRFIGGGVAPWVAGIAARHYGHSSAFCVGAVAVLLGLVVLATTHRLIVQVDERRDQETEEVIEEFLDSMGNVG
ncbi:MFS transporter [Mycobacterium malmoense]|nr:MFS transporter [Mycobacterium malmoense]